MKNITMTWLILKKNSLQHFLKRINSNTLGSDKVFALGFYLKSFIETKFVHDKDAKKHGWNIKYFF